MRMPTRLSSSFNSLVENNGTNHAILAPLNTVWLSGIYLPMPVWRRSHLCTLDNCTYQDVTFALQIRSIVHPHTPRLPHDYTHHAHRIFASSTPIYAAHIPSDYSRATCLHFAPLAHCFSLLSPLLIPRSYIPYTLFRTTDDLAVPHFFASPLSDAIIPLGEAALEKRFGIQMRPVRG